MEIDLLKLNAEAAPTVPPACGPVIYAPVYCPPVYYSPPYACPRCGPLARFFSRR